MKKTFTSSHSDFSTRITGMYLRIIIIIPLCLFAVTGLVYNILYYEGPKLYSKFKKISEGIAFMSPTAMIITVISSIVFALVLLLIVTSYYSQREIITGLTFDDENSKITVETKTIKGVAYSRVHLYTDLKLKRNHLSDGMTPPMYTTLTLKKGDYLAGHLYEDHFTWPREEYSEIEKMLKARIK